MGKQSARMVYQGKDHKEIVYQGNYHNAIVKENKVIWYKIYDNYCISLSGDVIDVDKRKVVLSGVTDVMQCEGATLIAVKSDLENIEDIYSSVGMILWKKIKEVNIDGYSLGRYYRQRSPHNSIIYEKYSGNMLYLKILKYSNEEIQERNIEISLSSDYESSYFYNDHIFVNNSDLIWICEESETEYIVHIVHEDGSIVATSYKKWDFVGYPEFGSYSPLVCAHDTNEAYYINQMVTKIGNVQYKTRELYLYSIDENGNKKRRGLMGYRYGNFIDFKNRYVASITNGFVICMKGEIDGGKLIPGKDYNGGCVDTRTSLGGVIGLSVYTKNGIRLNISASSEYGGDISKGQMTCCGIYITSHPDLYRYVFIWQYYQDGVYGDRVVIARETLPMDISTGYVILLED